MSADELFLPFDASIEASTPPLIVETDNVYYAMSSREAIEINKMAHDLYLSLESALPQSVESKLIKTKARELSEFINTRLYKSR